MLRETWRGDKPRADARELVLGERRASLGWSNKVMAGFRVRLLVVAVSPGGVFSGVEGWLRRLSWWSPVSVGDHIRAGSLSRMERSWCCARG